MLRLDFNLVFTIINLLIFYVLVKKFLFDKVTAVMEKRRVLIKERFVNAQQTEKQANAKKIQYDEALVSVKDESERIVSQARIDAKAEYEKMVETAEQEAGKIIKEARASAESEKERTMHELESQVAGLAMTAVKKLLSGQSSDAYDRFLREMGETNESNRS